MKNSWKIDYAEIICFPEGPRSPGLHQDLEKIFGVRAERGKAIGGSSVAPNPLLEIAINGRALSRSERGCANSHVLANRRALLAQADWALFLEDDVVILGSPTQPACQQILGLGQNSPTVVHLGSPGAQSGAPLARFSKQEVIRSIVPPTGTYAYIANRPAILLLSELSLNSGQPADWPIVCYRDDFRFYELRVPLFFHDDSLGRMSDRVGLEGKRLSLKRLLHALGVLRTFGVGTRLALKLLLLRKLVFVLSGAMRTLFRRPTGA